MAHRLLRSSLGVDATRTRVPIQVVHRLRSVESRRCARRQIQLARPLCPIKAENRCRYSSSAKRAKSDDQGGVDDRFRGFTWREAPPLTAASASALDSFRDRLFSHYSERCFGQVLSQEHILTMVGLRKGDKEFAEGVKRIFTGLAATLFKIRMSDVIDPRLSRNWKKNEENGGGIPFAASAAWSEDAPATAWTEDNDEESLPSSSADKLLIRLISKTREETRERGAVPYYRLHSINPSDPVNPVIIVDLPRNDRSEYSGRVLKSGFPPWGIWFIDPFEFLENNAFQDFKGWTHKRHFTVRVDVNVPCIETFFVKDRASNEIIQGSEEPKARIHRLRLEAGNTRDGVHWQVVDLDDWLDGNEYWRDIP